MIMSSFTKALASKKASLYGFLSSLSLNMAFLPMALYLLKTLKPFPFVFIMAVSVFSFIFSVFFLMLMYMEISGRIDGEKEPGSENRQVNITALFISFTGASFFIGFILFLLSMLMGPWFGLFAYAVSAGTMVYIVSVLVYILLFLIVCIAFAAANLLYPMIIRGDVFWGNLPKGIGFALKSVLTRPGGFIKLLALCIVMLAAGFFAENLFDMIFDVFVPDVFLRQYIAACAVSAVEGFISLVWGFTAFRFLYENNIPAMPGMVPKNVDMKGHIDLLKNKGLFSKGFLIILALLGLMNIVPTGNSLEGSFMMEYQDLMKRAKVLENTGRTDLASFEYRNAYAVAAAISGYSKIRLAALDKDRQNLYQEGAAEIEKALQFAPASSSAFFIKAMSMLGTNDSGAVPFFIYSYMKDNGNLDALYGMLYCYRSMGDAENSRKTVYEIISKRYYFYGLDGMLKGGKGKYDDMQKKFSEFSAKAFEGIPVKAMDDMARGDYGQAFNELSWLKQQSPDDTLINYLFATAALVTSNEKGNYGIAAEAAEKVYKSMPDGDGARLFKGEIAMKTQDYKTALDMMELLYRKHPDYISVAEQYAYLLSKNNADDGAMAAVDDILGRTQDSWFACYLKSVLLLKKSDYKGSIENIEAFMKITSAKANNTAKADDSVKAANNISDLREFYDKYLYAFSLAYSLTTKDPEAVKAAENIKGSDELLYSYILGTTAWRDKDMAKGTGLFGKVAGMDPDLAYPHFLLGNILYEDAVRSGRHDFEKGEAEYKKALAIKPDFMEAWFALAHTYDKWGKKEEAYNAFQQVVRIKPYEDHTSDYYGIIVHSWGKINEMKQYLEQNKGGGQ